MVAKLKITVERKYLRGVFSHINLDKSGAIEFEEFYTFATIKTKLVLNQKFNYQIPYWFNYWISIYYNDEHNLKGRCQQIFNKFHNLLCWIINLVYYFEFLWNISLFKMI